MRLLPSDPPAIYGRCGLQLRYGVLRIVRQHLSKHAHSRPLDLADVFLVFLTHPNAVDQIFQPLLIAHVPEIERHRSAGKANVEGGFRIPDEHKELVVPQRPIKLPDGLLDRIDRKGDVFGRRYLHEASPHVVLRDVVIDKNQRLRCDVPHPCRRYLTMNVSVIYAHELDHHSTPIAPRTNPTPSRKKSTLTGDHFALVKSL